MPLGEHERRPPLRLFLVFGTLLVVFVALGTLVDLQREASQRRVGPGAGGAQGAGAAGQAARCGEHPTAAVRELRGMWLTTVNNIDWPSQPRARTETVKAEYLGWLDLAQRHNHNAIFVHVRPSGDAFWPSQYAPWSEWLTGRRDGRTRAGTRWRS